MAVADWFSGFDYLPASSLTIGVTPLFTATTGDVSATQFRTGSRSLDLQATNGYAYRSGLTARATYSLGFWMRVSSLAVAGNICALGEGDLTTPANCHISIRLTTAGKLQVLRGGGVGSGQASTTQIGSDSTNTIAINTGYHVVVTVLVSNTVGTVTVTVNGSSTGWQALTGQDTQNGGAAQISAFGLGGNVAATPIYYDDVWLAATDLGDCRVTPINASTGDGTLADFTPSTGTDNGAMVDENPPDGDTTYNSSTVITNRDTYNFPASGITGAMVHGVKLHNYCRKQDAGTVSMKPVIRIGGNNYEGAEQFLPTTYSHVTQQYDTSPATAAAWTVAEIDGAEFGIRHHG